MYSTQNLYDRIEHLIYKYYPKENPISLYLNSIHSKDVVDTEVISIKLDFKNTFKKKDLLDKDNFMQSTIEYSKLLCTSIKNYENERFLMRLKKLNSIKKISNTDDLKKVEITKDICVICSENTKLKLIQNNISLPYLTFDALPINQGIIASTEDFLSKCSIESFNILPAKSKLNIKCSEIEIEDSIYFPYQERRNLTEIEIKEFINENYKLELFYEAKLIFPKNTTCTVFEI